MKASTELARLGQGGQNIIYMCCSKGVRTTLEGYMHCGVGSFENTRAG